MANQTKTTNTKQDKKIKHVNIGRIGKPQKSRKHKLKKTGARNPLLEDRNKKEKNFEPGKDDDQWIPRGVKEMIWAQEKLKNGKKKVKTNKRRGLIKDTEKGVTKTMEKEPKFVQGKTEGVKAFMERVNHESKMMIYEKKAQIRQTDNADKVEKKTKKPTKPIGERKRERKREKRQKKAEDLKVKKLDKKGDFSDFKDPVMFGEVVDEPPSLTAKPRKAESKDANNKLGRKTLLLTQMFQQEDKDSDSDIKLKHKSFPAREVGKTVKRKHLSFAQKRINDAERDTAIDQYRKMKAKKMKRFDDSD